MMQAVRLACRDASGIRVVVGDKSSLRGHQLATTSGDCFKDLRLMIPPFLRTLALQPYVTQQIRVPSLRAWTMGKGWR